MANEEPPYLAVGTDVSAKYKGAFCEAKVKKVTRSVKCKITFKNNLGSITVNDDQIKGNLRVNAQVEVRHPEKNQFFDAVINKLHDQSQYTVVFDDGDETTLRRTSLCLKSGRHFAESETLDQLPLTHPEHFGTPVMGSKGRKRRSLNRSIQDDGSSDEEISPPPKKKEYKIREPDPDIGKVVCVEMNEKKKAKDNWFPALIVSPSAQDSVKVTQKEDYLVRSFKDGKYYCICKKETKEFTREVGAKVDNNTLKIAVEKAQIYNDKGELPPHWDRDILFRRELTTDEGESNEDSDSETSDDEPSEEKDRFVAQLYKFMDDRGTPINKAPTVSNRDLNLYKLFKVVQKLGGYNRVTNHMQWKTVYTKMGLPAYNSSSSHHIKQAYKKYLHGFEDFYRKLGCSMGTSTRAGRMRHRSSRKITMLTRDREREYRAVGRKKQENKSKKKEEKVKEECPEDKKDEDELDESKDEDEEKVEEVKDDDVDHKEEDKSKAKEEKKTKPKKEKLMKKGDKDVDKGNKPKGRRKIVREEGSDKSQDTTDEGDFCSDVEINVGDKVRVKYGRGRHQKIYEAKVLELEEENGEKHFYVHYTGWNMRYDEWVNRQRIVENLSLKVRKGRSAGSPKASLVKIPAKRGRPPMSAGKGPSTSRKMGMNTSKSRATRSDKNSLNDSPFVNGLEPQRRVRSRCGPKTPNKGSSDESSSDESDLGLSPDGKKLQERPENIKVEDNKEQSDEDEESIKDIHKEEDEDYQKVVAKKEKDDEEEGSQEGSPEDEEESPKIDVKVKNKDKVEKKNKEEIEASGSDAEISGENSEEKSPEKNREVKTEESEDEVCEEVSSDTYKVKRRGRRKTKKKKEETLLDEENDADDEEAKPTTDEEEKEVVVKIEVVDVKEDKQDKLTNVEEMNPEVENKGSFIVEAEENFPINRESVLEEIAIETTSKLSQGSGAVADSRSSGEFEMLLVDTGELSVDEASYGSGVTRELSDLTETPKREMTTSSIDDKELDADLEKLAKQTKKMTKLKVLKSDREDTDQESTDSSLELKTVKDVRLKTSKLPEVDVMPSLPIKLDASEKPQEIQAIVPENHDQTEVFDNTNVELSQDIASTMPPTTVFNVPVITEQTISEVTEKLTQETIVVKSEESDVSVLKLSKESKKPKSSKREDQSNSEVPSDKSEEPKKKIKDEEKKNKVKKSKDKKRMKKDESSGKDIEKIKKKESKKRKEEKLKKFDSDVDSRESSDNRKEKKKSRKNKQDDKRRDCEPAKKKSKKKFPKDEKFSDDDNGKKSSKKSGKRKKKKGNSSDDPESVKSKKTDKQSKSELAKLSAFHQEEETTVSNMKEDSENEDMMTNLLICQEDVPLSPVGEDVVTKADVHLSSFPQTSRFDIRPLLPLSFSSNNSSGSGSSSCTSGSIKDSHRDSRFAYQKQEPITVLDNTPPTTPESGGESVLSGSIHEQDNTSQSAGMDDNSSKSGPESYIDLETYGDVSQLVCHENVDFGQSEAAMVLGSMGVVQEYQKEQMVIDVPTMSSNKRLCQDNDDLTPTKKRKKGRQRCHSGNEIKGMNVSRYRSSNKMSKLTGSDSDETTHSEQTTLFQTMSIVTSGSCSGSSYTGSDREVNLLPSTVSRSPRPSKFNFFVELDDYSDGSQRIAIIQEKLTELKKTYMALKAEVACIDRRRKKLRRKEKDGTASTLMSSTTEVECS